MELGAKGNIQSVISNLKIIKERLEEEKDNQGATLCVGVLKQNIELLEYTVKKYSENERSFY